MVICKGGHISLHTGDVAPTSMMSSPAPALDTMVVMTAEAQRACGGSPSEPPLSPQPKTSFYAQSKSRPSVPPGGNWPRGSVAVALGQSSGPQCASTAVGGGFASEMSAADFGELCDESLGFASGSAGTALESAGSASGSAGPALQSADSASGSAGPALESAGSASGSAGTALESEDSATTRPWDETIERLRRFCDDHASKRPRH